MNLSISVKINANCKDHLAFVIDSPVRIEILMKVEIPRRGGRSSFKIELYGELEEEETARSLRVRPCRGYGLNKGKAAYFPRWRNPC